MRIDDKRNCREAEASYMVAGVIAWTSRDMSCALWLHVKKKKRKKKALRCGCRLLKIV